MTTGPLRIAMWSGPRNISTAMMRAFENRADTAVWDEPFYAFYLAQTGLDHPMREQVIAAGEAQEWLAVARDCADNPVPGGATIFYQKHMTHHMLPEIGLDWMSRVSNAFLIRRPEAVIASYHDRRADPEMADLGFEKQAELFDRVCQFAGAAPPVLDSDRVLADPESALRALCSTFALEFDPAMLSWPAGRRDSDGAWAPHWYRAVEASTGFAEPGATRPLPGHLTYLADQCRPYYERLAAYCL